MQRHSPRHDSSPQRATKPTKFSTTFLAPCPFRYLCTVGKRNIRVLRHQLSDRLSELPGKEAHVVMRDGSTHFGLVISASATQIEVRDANAAWTQRKRHTHILPMTDVMEVIFDIVTAF
jgi:hypothetical protein